MNQTTSTYGMGINMTENTNLPSSAAVANKALLSSLRKMKSEMVKRNNEKNEYKRRAEMMELRLLQNAAEQAAQQDLERDKEREKRRRKKEQDKEKVGGTNEAQKQEKKIIAKK
ncbi:MAG: hypothetical protein EZS28_021209 [Streblomastix strix]|uniref:Uncharacterized protein n=1 Tax=Streblomastix strix TaxID=222440 RepID=A0A5J4VLD4_9EUKA|nr:MAG: hypothetical protein EZS28_021209 [Streblomastix strix]